MALKNVWRNKINGVDDVDAEDINNIAQAVIEIEENGVGNGGSAEIVIDKEMSDESANAVENRVIKNYVDVSIGNFEMVIDEIHAYAEALKGGEV